MRSLRKGFTLIEVAIFLAITGMLFVGIVAGVQGSLNMQRENDVAQNFMEFLRGVYSQVTNVQNPAGSNGGRSEKAIYGKMVTFGESRTLTGEVNNAGEIFVYTVVGRIKDSGTGDALTLLNDLDATVLEEKTNDLGNTELTYAGLVETYTPKWGASLEKVCGSGAICNPESFSGTLLIVRHPTSGNVYTYFNDKVIDVNAAKMEGKKNLFKHGDINYLTDPTLKFKQQAVEICLNTEGEMDSNAKRFEVKIAKQAASGAGVGLVTEEESKCKK